MNKYSVQGRCNVRQMKLHFNYLEMIAVFKTFKAFKKETDKVEIVVTPKKGVKEQPYQC